MNSSMNDKNQLSSIDLSATIPPTKSRRGRKRVTDPVLATELRRHRRSRANDRERTRMRSLNEALEHLRTLLPLDSSSSSSSSSYSTDLSNQHCTLMEDKLTKIETLRTASAYIRLLTDLLDDNNHSSPTSHCSYQLSDHSQQTYQHSSYFGYPPTYSYYHSYY
ncbi:hypothetical protein I4U23_007652 [Adineta vaga]|nr:hypothetical protein I4U23_007652 [Adineta vaga]